MSPQSRLRKPEIMSPAGHWPQLHAAIEAGADSVYFGLKHFSARAKVGFSLEELPEVMRTLHARGVKGFVTFNTLVFDHELPEAARALAAIAEAGADALIIQDYGVLQLAHRIAPDLELHASTQMSISDAAGVRLAQRSGVSRVTLARELSLADIRAIKAATTCELEIFVHGALCVAYSGQCFSSEAWGGRSANRGQCAQACRLPYELLVDGQIEPLGDARYLLSPGDLYALHHVPAIVDIGISSLKIEGRYKDAGYVALTTSAYRKAVDLAFAGRALDISPADDLCLEQVYSRGLGPWFLEGVNHQKVVRGRAPRHRGVLAGRVVRLTQASIILESDPVIAAAPLKPGDGVVFDAADWRSPQEPEEGGRLYSVTPLASGELELGFANRALDHSRIRAGDLLWRTDDPDTVKASRPFLEPNAPVRRQPLHVDVFASEGTHLRTVWSLAAHPEIAVSVESEDKLGRATHRALDKAHLREQLGRLGNTPWELATVTLLLQGEPFVSASVLNALRRSAVEQLTKLQAAASTPHINEPGAVLAEALTRREKTGVAPLAPQLHLLVRNPAQLDAALAARPASITLDYLDLYGLKPSVDRVESSGIEARVATPRIAKPGEERVLEFLIRLDCPLLVRAAGMLESLQSAELTGDFSLNAANALTTAAMLQMGLKRLTPTHDLNAAQITSLAESVPPHALEVIAYGHLPVFHTEHCVFCRFLSTGTSYKDCGRPCEKHQVALQDASGRAHPVIADVGCRNTVFGAEAQEGSAYLDEWLDAGIRHFRLEFAHESASEVAAIAHAFSAFFDGIRSREHLAQDLRRLAPQGTTHGSFFVPANHLILPVLQ